MKLQELRNLQELYFGHEELSRVLGITTASARVAACRYTRLGLLIRLKRDMYMLREVWNAAGKEEKFRLANLGQTPSYISLTTALDYYEITTQLQQDFIESIAIKRTKEIRLNGHIFRYTKIAKDLYFGFKKVKNFFIATPEKALLDAFYLLSHARYQLDISAINPEKIDTEKLKHLSKSFPLKTQKILEKHGYSTTA